MSQNLEAGPANPPRGGVLKRHFKKFVGRLVMRYIAPISRHPLMTVVTGTGLLLSGMVELFEDVFTDFDSVIGVHQAVILLGVVTFFKGLADVVEASEWLSRGVNEEAEESGA